jgi:hypothetical protein
MIEDQPTPDLARLNLAELFRLYRGILAELRRRKIVRTENAPAGDYAEYLVAAAFGGELAGNSEKSYDILSADQERLQVKARVVSVPPKSAQLQLSPFRSFEFDAAVIVLLSDIDYSVWWAVKVPEKVVKTVGTYNSHVNGRILFARKELLKRSGAVDVTNRLRSVQLAQRNSTSTNISTPGLPAGSTGTAGSTGPTGTAGSTDGAQGWRA